MISYTSAGYFLESARVNSRHALCGPQHINGAVSPNSGLPLLLIASLDTADPLLGISSLKLDTLHLLYSWTCGISAGVFTYRESSKGLEIITYVKGPAQTDFPYESYPPFFPRVGADLKALTPDEQAIIERANRRESGALALARQFRLAVPRSQVGGEPRLMQWPLRACHCPICGDAMPLLASIGNHTGSALGFTDNDFVQTLFLLCAVCSVVTAYNLTD